MGKKKSPKTERGKLTRAGQLLSQFIRDIALEETEVVTIDGEDRMASKAEALARMVWKRGLGFIEKVKNEQGVLVDVKHAPDRVYVGMLWDRMEGRAPLMNPDKKDRRTIADKVSEQGKKRLNEIADSSLTS